MDIASNTLALLGAIGSTIVAIVALSSVIIERSRHRRELREEHRSDAALRLATEQHRIAVQEHRLAEASITVRHNVQLARPTEEANPEMPFVFSNIKIKNVGDGPVDIVASLMSARIVSGKYHIGAGLRGRNPGLDDFESLFWNHSNPQGLFTGISTTQDMTIAPDYFLRLAPHEDGVLSRIDAVNNIPLLISRSPLYTIYRLFLVTRSYPLVLSPVSF